MEVIQDTYKDTKIGRIPKDWGISKLGEITSLIKDGTHGTHKDFDGGIPLLSAKDIRNGIVSIPDDCRKISSEDYHKIHKNFRLQNDDILLTVVGSIGRVAILRGYNSDFTFQRSVAYIRLKRETLPGFYAQFFQANEFNKQLIMRSNASAQAGVYLGQLSKIPVPLPPLPEQQKIAAILSTVDEQISATDKIIEKSKELKKGLMQKLFSEGIGHTEFKDTKIGRIPKEWEVRNLNKCCGINKDSLSSSTKEDYSFYYLDLSLVKKGIIDFPNAKVDFKNAPSRARRKIKKGDILMSTVRPNLLGNGYINFDSEEYIASTGFAVLSNYKETNGGFLYHYLYSHNMQSQIERMLVGSNYPAINNKDVSILKIPFPLLKEQQKIADILSETDVKIEKELTQKAQLEALKKGLMQQLLTGKIRVKV